nr:retrotransposon protein, putative, unclassified [Tanacetum cinerariifolium]
MLVQILTGIHNMRFQRLLSLLEIHRAGVSTEDANQKFLRSLSLSWSNISLIMMNKPDIDTLDINDLYNNLKVYEADIKGSSGSSSNSQNVAFVSAKITSNTNELTTTYSVSTAIGYSSQAQDNEDLEQIDQDDLEEIDLKWQVAMLSMRVKQLNKKTRRKLEFNGKEPVGNRSRDVGNAGYRGRDNGKRPTKEEDEQALVVQDGLGTYNSSYQVEEEATDFALMAFTSNLSRSLTLNFDVQSYSKQCYDSQFNEKEVLDIKEEEVIEIVFDNRSSDEKNSLAKDRFKKGERYHAVPPPLTGNYMPLKSDLSFAGLDDSIYKFKISEIVTSLPKDEKDALKTSTDFVEKTKEVRTSAPLIKDWNTDSDNDSVFRPTHIPAKVDFVKVVFTRSGRILVSATKPKATASTSAAKPVNTVRPKQSVNFSKSRSTFHKSHSPIRRSFYNATAHSRRNSTERVNTDGSKAVSTIKGNGVTAVKTSADVKDEEAVDVDVHLYRSMIGSLMYLTVSRPDIMFAVYAYSRFQVTPKLSHLHAVKRIYMYLKVLWIKNQLSDYGFNLMNTKIYTDNESTICIVKYPVFHSKTKHIEIRPHFIRDAYEKKLIQVLKIHTDDNIANLLTKAFNVSRFKFLVVNIGLLNL